MDKPILESARKIKHLYKNLSYFDQYGTSIIICIVLLITGCLKLLLV